MITDKMRKEAVDVEFHWVNETGDVGELTAGANIKPTVRNPLPNPQIDAEPRQHSFATCPPLDIALMGAHDASYMMSETEIAFVQKVHNGCAAFLFICGGFLAALQAGLLKGKTATAPRPMVAVLRKSNPEVNWIVKRWARDGKVWTSGALLNGLDMTKAFVTEIWGGEGTLVEFVLRLGGYPERNINYADVPWDI